MAILADRQYTLAAFADIIREKSSEFDLPGATVNVINNLAQLVGAPSYQKTPVFKKRERGRPRPRHTISSADWEEIRNFQTTKLATKVDAIELEVDSVRTLLNKITESNYSKMKDKVVEVLTRALDCGEKGEACLLRLGESIFEIGCMNKFWAKLYARLYKDLISTSDVMGRICRKNLESFLSLFDDIRYVPAEQDYDAFCKTNKDNEKRRSLSSFFVHLMNVEVVTVERIVGLLTSLRAKFEACIDDAAKKNEVDEISQNLVILIMHGAKRLARDSGIWPDVMKFVERVVVMRPRKHPGLTSQTRFRFMDLLEGLEKQHR